MSAQLDNLSPIIAQPVAVAGLSIKDAVLAQFKDAETTISALANKYRDVAFDVATPKGMKEAVAARADLRDNGRLMVTKAEARIKGEVNDLKRVMSAEVDRLVAIVQPIEKHVDDQIKAEESRKAAEKAERERIAAEKAEVHRAKIAKIRAAAENAKGIASERIKNGIALVESLAFGPECEDFLPEYEKAKAETLAAMRQHLADAQAREAAEAQRLENERMAAELEAQRQALAAQAAELKRQQDEARAALVAITHAAVFSFPEPEEQPTQQVLKAEPEAADATARVDAAIASQSVGSMGAGQPADAGPAGDDLSAAAADCFAAINETEAAGAITVDRAKRLAETTAALVAEAAITQAQEDSAEVEWINTAGLSTALGLPMNAALVAELGFPGAKRAGPGHYWPKPMVKKIGLALIDRIRQNIGEQA